MSEWIRFDKASHRALIIAAYRSNKISGARAFEEFRNLNLWEDEEEAFFHYVNGLAADEARRQLLNAPGFVRRGVKRVVYFLYKKEHLRIDTAQHLIDLFGVWGE